MLSRLLLCSSCFAFGLSGRMICRILRPLRSILPAVVQVQQCQVPGKICTKRGRPQTRWGSAAYKFMPAIGDIACTGTVVHDCTGLASCLSLSHKASVPVEHKHIIAADGCIMIC